MQTNLAQLKNGIRVLFVNTPHVQSVTVGAFVDVGSGNENKKQNGISHFLEHMAFKGTEKRSYLDISSTAERLGANMNAYTSQEHTAYYVGGLNKHLPVFVELLGDILLNSTYPENELEVERGVITQEYESRFDSPVNVAYTLFDYAAFGDTPMGRPIIGSKKNISSFTRDDIVQYMKKHYTGSNIIVAVVGNFDEGEALKLVEEHFGGFTKGKRNKKKEVQYIGGVKIDKKKFTQSTVVMGFPSAPGNQKDHYIDHVVASVLGDGMSSPLFDEVREKAGLVYGISSFNHVMKDASSMFVSAQTTPDNLDKLFGKTVEVMKRHTHDIRDADLERAKNTLTVRIVRRSERPFNVASNIIDAMYWGIEHKNVQESIDLVQAVTKQQVMDRLSEILQQTPTLSLVGKGSDEKYYDVLLESLK